MKKAVLFLLVLLCAAAFSFAQITIPHEFRTGTPARADHMNENFDEVEEAINEQIALTAGLNTATSAGQVLTWTGESWIARSIPPDSTYTLSLMQPYLTINFCIALVGTFPSRNGNDPLLAEIMLFAANFAPRGWALCNGQLLSISQNSALFSLLGTTYGGDGRTTFGLPDFRGRVPLSSGSGPGLPSYQMGQRGGASSAIVYR